MGRTALRERKEAAAYVSTLGGRAALARLEAGLTPGMAAVRLHRRRAWVLGVEANDQTLRPADAARLAGLYGVALDYMDPATAVELPDPSGSTIVCANLTDELLDETAIEDTEALRAFLGRRLYREISTLFVDGPTDELRAEAQSLLHANEEGGNEEAFDHQSFDVDFDVGDLWRQATLSPRTMLTLAIALDIVVDELAMEIYELGDRPVEIERRSDGDHTTTPKLARLPRFTWRERQPWRNRVVEAGLALMGDWVTGVAPEPRCPAEEAVLELALEEAARFDTLPEPVLELPSSPYDFEWDSLRDLLFQDGDMRALMDRDDLDGLEDPRGEDNLLLGVGDYRPAAWFDWFLNVAPRSTGGSAG